MESFFLRIMSVYIGSIGTMVDIGIYIVARHCAAGFYFIETMFIIGCI